MAHDRTVSERSFLSDRRYTRTRLSVAWTVQTSNRLGQAMRLLSGVMCKSISNLRGITSVLWPALCVKYIVDLNTGVTHGMVI